MASTLEFLDEALDEAEAAAQWYARRSPRSAAGFSDEIDTAIAAIQRLKKGGLHSSMELVDTCSDVIRSALSTGSSAVAFLSSRCHMNTADPATGNSELPTRRATAVDPAETLRQT